MVKEEHFMDNLGYIVISVVILCVFFLPGLPKALSNLPGHHIVSKARRLLQRWTKDLEEN